MRDRRGLFLLALLTLPLGVPAGRSDHPMPEKPVALLPGLGRHHHPIATKNAEAQKFFDEGLALLYGFNHEEAFRSFERAAALDDKAPMPHWGMSLALGTNYNDTATPDRIQQAYAHLSHAEQRAANGSDVERAFVAALVRSASATRSSAKRCPWPLARSAPKSDRGQSTRVASG